MDTEENTPTIDALTSIPKGYADFLADKDQVPREAFRVLKPGRRFAVSDVVVGGELPAAVRADMEAYVGCVAGALEVGGYKRRLDGRIMGAVIRAVKPAAGACCGPTCCAKG